MTTYVPKYQIYPKFGLAIPELGVAMVRSDLPGPVKKFVEQHELYHLRDKSKWWVWREVKANIYGAYKHPFGFIGAVFMTVFSWDRWLYYLSRIGE